MMPLAVESQQAQPGTRDSPSSQAEIPDSDHSSNDKPVDTTPPRGYSVLSENIALVIDFGRKSIQGRADIYVTTSDEHLSEIFLDARQCKIDVDKVTVSGCPTSASYDDPCGLACTPAEFEWGAEQWGVRKRRMRPLLHHKRDELSALDHEKKMQCTPASASLRIAIPSAAIITSLWKIQVQQGKLQLDSSDPLDKLVLEKEGSEVHKITVFFAVQDIREGLQFVGLGETDARYPHVYTRHSIGPGTASSIFPCVDDPACRSNWKVSITCPRTLGDAFHQPLAKLQPSSAQGTVGAQPAKEGRKRKLGEEQPRVAEQPKRYHPVLAEEDKLLEMTVVCSGKLVDEVMDEDDESTKTMTFECINKAATHIGFAVGPFEHVDLGLYHRSDEDDLMLGANATKVHGYCLPGRSAVLDHTCAALVTAMDHFSLTYGRYTFDSFKVCFVDDMIAETVPLCGFTLCSNRLLYPEDIIDTELDVTRALVHSLACQWFGVNIIPDLKSDIWLVVAIAWFMTDLFLKKLCGMNEYRFRMKAMSDLLVEADMNRPSLHTLGEHLHLGDFEVDFMNLKAPMVLFILDRRLSKTSGGTGISGIIRKMISKANAGTNHAEDSILQSLPFRKTCEKTGRARLDTFWNQWVVCSGCPRFDVFHKFNKKRLCVETTIRQIQDIAAAKTRPLDKDAFWRDVKEERHRVWAGEQPHVFAGPMTIRIHEADGTPYEHIVDIREETGKTAKFDIPYSTKYKRLKKSRRNNKHNAGGASNAKGNDEAAEETFVSCLGDVLQSPEDVEEWGFKDWDEHMEVKMDNESYEWIRMDADFEWICNVETGLEAYMYVSQLQQDRDIVAQQDSMLFLARNSVRNPHPLVSTILTRTLMDPRYFYGIRTMAAEILPRHAVADVDRIGLVHLEKSYRELYCRDGSGKPQPNDFSDKRRYFVQCAIVTAMARVRDWDGKCPKEACQFILRLLLDNDNTANTFSDDFYICKLIEALATCQIPEGKKVKSASMSLASGALDADDDEDDDGSDAEAEAEAFRAKAFAEIERYRQMDEYAPSYQNVFTRTALDAYCRLMKAKVMDTNPIIFVQYLQDKTLDVVRIKAFECLVDLGCLPQPKLLQYFMSVMATDPSPFVRDRLFKVLCRGLASIAIGDHETTDSEKAPSDADENGLIVDHGSETSPKEKLQALARRENLGVALDALRNTTRDNDVLKEAVWTALESPVTSVAEKVDLLELCSILFEEHASLIYRVKYPKRWAVDRRERGRNKLTLTFTPHFKFWSNKHYQAVPKPEPVLVRPEPPKKIKLDLSRKSSISVPRLGTPTGAMSPPPQPATKTAIDQAVKGSQARDAVRPLAGPVKDSGRDSIAVQAPARSSSQLHGSERKPLPKGSTFRAPASMTANGPRVAATPAKTGTLPKPKPMSKTQGLTKSQGVTKTARPQKSRASAKPQSSAKLPGLPKSNKASTAAPGTASVASASQAPRGLKRPSIDDEDGPRASKPAKIARLSKVVKLKLPKEKLACFSKIVTLSFTQWNKVKGLGSGPGSRPRTETGTGARSGSGSIRATPKSARPAKQKQSVSKALPRPATPIPHPVAPSSSSPPQPASQSSSTPSRYSGPPSRFGVNGNGNGIGGVLEAARKPLPSGERKPLPSASTSASKMPAPSNTPKKIKIMVNTKREGQKPNT